MAPVHPYTLRKRAPDMDSRDVYDAHPDALWLSPDHLYPQPGWLFLVAYGPRIENGSFTYTYIPGMDHFFCDHWLIPMTVRVAGGSVGRDREGFASTYHHPSEEWVREVARQLISGEREIQKHYRDYDRWIGPLVVHTAHIPVCTVDIFRKIDPSTPDYETSTLVQEMKAPSCIGCGGAEERWER